MKTLLHGKKKLLSPQSHCEDGNNHPKCESVWILLCKQQCAEEMEQSVLG